MLRFLTSGESHGKCLVGVLEGLPAGMSVDMGFIDAELERRQQGYGRGGRMQIEKDRIEILSGVRHGRTIGSPVSFTLQNKDWPNWQISMSPEAVPKGSETRPLTQPRPGHGDLAGALKHHTHDARDILERASARETAVRVVIGSLCKLLLAPFGIRLGSHVLAIGSVRVSERFESALAQEILDADPRSPLTCLDFDAEARMRTSIDEARAAGETLGGIVEAIAAGVPPGLGSHAHWDRRLDGQMAQALMSIPAVKAVEIGVGVAAASRWGSEVHDEISYDAAGRRFCRRTNRAGGLEAGITNGEDLRLRLYLKPIPTLRKAMMSVDLVSKKPSQAAFERSDTCVVPAVGVIAEAMVAFVLARAFLEKFGCDSIPEIETNLAHYRQRLEQY